MKAAYILGASLVFGLWSSQAFAQQGQSAESVTQTDDDEGLGTIVVTAQKREQNLQEVPLAVTTVGGEALQASGVVDTTRLNVVAPAVNIRVTNSNFSPSIRGVGTAGINVENPVSLYIDGVYYASQREGLRDLHDIEQVAVLKGPQGTMFGRNSTGGVIQITTKSPSHTFEGELGVSLDQYATLRAHAYVAGGLSDTVVASLSGTYATQGEGWGDNLTTGADTYRIDYNWSLRGQLLIDIGEDTQARLIGDYGRRADNMATYFRPFPGTQLLLPGFTIPDNVYDSIVNLDPRSTLRGGGVSLTVDHDFDFAKITSITAYRDSTGSFRLDADATPLSVFHVRSPDTRNFSFSQELQLTSRPGSAVNWAIGAYYFYNRNRARDFAQIFGGPFAPLPTSVNEQQIFGRETAESIAPFGQVDFEILPRTRLTLGARWTYEKRDFVSRRSNLLNNGQLIPVVVPFDGASITVKKPTWRIAVDHKFSDDILGYAYYSRGFKSGGFNILNPANPPYDTEQLDAYEVGLKTELFNNAVRVNVAGFYYDYANIQVLQFIGGAQVTVNGPKAEIYGLDLDFEARLAKGLSVRGGLVWLHDKFINFPNALLSTPLPNGGAALRPGDASGNQLPNAQRFNATVSLDYRTDVSFGELAFNVTESHNGAFFFEPDNRLRQGAYDLVNASITWTSRDGEFSLSLFAQNLLGEEVRTHATTIPFGYMSTQFLAPRVYGASAKFRF